MLYLLHNCVLRSRKLNPPSAHVVVKLGVMVEAGATTTSMRLLLPFAFHTSTSLDDPAATLSTSVLDCPKLWHDCYQGHDTDILVLALYLAR